MSDPIQSPRPVYGPDFSGLDSQAKVEEWFRRGDLEKLYLMPLDFGGSDNPLNTLYVPVGMAEVKERIDDNIIRPLIEDGKVSQYKAEAKYQGSSFVPICIDIIASDPGRFEATVKIWGDALPQNAPK